ncbi:hypothetical protein MKX03_021345 [Papaver bracteatum]|nr:hypothetical protein MKX03_021345 [Papaver bracteatum]
MWKQLQKMFSNEEEYSRLNNPDETFTSFFRTPLHLAVMSGDTKFAAKILSQKSDLVFKRDSNGFTPLHLASVRTSLPMVRLLLKANPGACIVQDEDGRTPLHLTAMKNRIEIMKLLMEEGLPEALHQINDQNGETILHFCVKNNSKLKTLKLLAGYLVPAQPSYPNSISINSTDFDGNTILHLATETGNMKITNYLLLNGSVRIDINVVNNKGVKALNLLSHADKNELQFGFYGYHVRHDKHKIKTPTLKDRVNALMVVATLIAGIAFQSAMNPPGGVWQEDSKVNSNTDPVTFAYYLSRMFSFSISGTLEGYIDNHLKPYASDNVGGKWERYLNIKDFVNALTNMRGRGYRSMMLKGLILQDLGYTDAVSNYTIDGNSFPYLIRYAGSPILAYTWPDHYVINMVTNGVAFFASLTIIFLVICGLVIEKSVTQVRILVLLMCLSMGCIAFGYFSLSLVMMPDFFEGTRYVFFVLFLFCGICCLFGALKFFFWTVLKIVKVRKRARNHHIHIGVINYLKALFFSLGANAAGKFILFIGGYCVFRLSGYVFWVVGPTLTSFCIKTMYTTIWDARTQDARLTLTRRVSDAPNTRPARVLFGRTDDLGLKHFFSIFI